METLTIVSVQTAIRVSNLQVQQHDVSAGIDLYSNLWLRNNSLMLYVHNSLNKFCKRVEQKVLEFILKLLVGFSTIATSGQTNDYCSWLQWAYQLLHNGCSHSWIKQRQQGEKERQKGNNVTPNKFSFPTQPRRPGFRQVAAKESQNNGIPFQCS